MPRSFATIQHRRRLPRPHVLSLEPRILLAAVSVDVNQVVRTVNANLLGVNVAWWDSNLNSATTKTMVQAAGLTSFRFPGGSSSDEYHFNTPPSYPGKGTVATFANFIASVNGGGMVTLNYGTGSPQEAAALLAYLDAPAGNTTSIGVGEQWNTATGTWIQKTWNVAGYWAALRAATPLPSDDGLNFLRIGHFAPFGFKYFEVGNEVYGSWETDKHGSPGDTGAAHDPATYVAFAKQFAAYAAKIAPGISIGVCGNGPSDPWTANVLNQCISQGYTPNFMIDHRYAQGPGSESDATLLAYSSTWATQASGYRTLLQQKLGSAAANVELLLTELNSVYANTGKQTTSLVNGLFIADSLGSMLQTEYDGAWVWDLRNGWSTGNNNSSSLYGWRMGGDYGLLGDSVGPAPQTGTYIAYPSYFAEQLCAKILHTGDTVVKATSGDSNLDVFAVREQNGHLDLLVINKNASSNLSGAFNLANFAPGSSATYWQYGKAEDTAQSLTTDGHAALTTGTVALALAGSSFNYTFPSYSMTVLDIAPPALSISAGGAQSVLPGAALGTALAVMVRNGAGNPMPGVPVTFSPPASGAGGSFPGGGSVIVIGNASGLATAPAFTANTLLGGYAVTATSPSSAPVTFTLSNAVPGVTLASGAVCSLTGAAGSQTLQASAGSITITSDLSASLPGCALSITGTATATLSATEHLGALLLAGTAAVKLGTGGSFALFTSSLSIAPGASLDLADNPMILSYGSASPVDVVRQYIQAGKLFTSASQPAAGHFATLAQVDNNQIRQTAWSNVTVSNGTNFSQVLVKRAYLGDTNLDGQVSQSDYLNVFANLSHGNAQWLDGDLNHDGEVNTDDLAMVTVNLGTGTGGGNGPQLLLAPVRSPAIPMRLKVAPKPALPGASKRHLTSASRQR